ncbi:iron-containing alcohol dehydrogenase [Chloroflexota bacterium]
MPYRPFIVPRNIYYGPGSLEALTGIQGERILIVTDPVVSALGLVKQVEKILHSRQAKTLVFDQVEPDPSNNTVWSIFSQARDFQPDLFIGLGGGSSIDAGKGAWALYEHPDLADLSLADVQKELPGRELRQKARYVAIPTTSGTGSEVTRVAVVTDHNIEPHLKVSWFSPHLVPDIAIADPELASSMPPEVTANTGFDALVHAVECYVLSEPSELVDSLALGATVAVWSWLPEAVSDGKNILARDKMHLASLQAGMAFSNAMLWLVHVPAHELGSSFGFAHGRACAFLLCSAFASVYSSYETRLSSLATSLGIIGENNKEKVTGFLDGLDQLKQKIGIPLAIKDTGLKEAIFQDQLGIIINRCVDNIGNRAAANPKWIKAISSVEMRKILMHAWNGTRAELS